MAKKQTWITEIDGTKHVIHYSPRTLFSRAKITINGNTYPLYSAKLFGESQDAFKLGDSRAIITIAKNKKATVAVDGEVLGEN